nr:UvrD-helicase domain-containing protein [Bradyrhizobium sp. 180]
MKLWALSNPAIAADFILLDEAQDTNPVVLDVLRKQPAQMVYVGDKYQQIYEWRGAVIRDGKNRDPE